jgi:ABC-2 type transport system permease protein
MRGALAVSGRVLLSLRGDPRTLAMVFVAPVFIFFLFGQIFDLVPPGRINVAFLKPVLLGVFAFILTYLLTAIGFLRERQTGTLERVLASPVTRMGLVTGYMTGFGALALLQSAVLLGAGVAFLDIEVAKGIPLFFLMTVLGALSALGLGVLVSMFAQTEFQVIQFVPVVIAPQFILGGVFLPVEALPWWLEWPARGMPLTYLLDGLDFVVLGSGGQGDYVLDSMVLLGFTVLSGLLAALLVRRA